MQWTAVLMALVLATAAMAQTPVKCDVKGITIDLGGGATTFKRWPDPIHRHLDDTPQVYREALRLHSAGRHAAALVKYVQALEGAPRSVWLPQFVGFYRAQCLEAQGKSKEALTVLRTLQKNFPKGRFALEALDLLGQHALQGGKTGEALLHYQTLGKLAKYAERGEVWATLGLAEVALAAGKTKEALRRFRRVRKSVRAKLGAARALLALGRTDDARREFQAVVDRERATSQQLAVAYTGLGRCAYHKGADLQEALRSYLKVLVLYGQVREAQPEALWHASNCLHHLRHRGTSWESRSQQLFAELRDRYPASRWARKGRTSVPR